MKRATVCLLIALALTAAGRFPASAAYDKDPDLIAGREKYSPEKLLEDFKIMRSSLEEGHSGIYRYTSKAELARAGK